MQCLCQNHIHTVCHQYFFSCSDFAFCIYIYIRHTITKANTHFRIVSPFLPCCVYISYQMIVLDPPHHYTYHVYIVQYISRHVYLDILFSFLLHYFTETDTRLKFVIREQTKTFTRTRANTMHREGERSRNMDRGGHRNGSRGRDGCHRGWEADMVGVIREMRCC